ncbi:MAG: diadenylate cyclase CdaA [Clostridia bacterium]|nr:diadenylate cyclase CdaA [Clostridia bacterium]
MEAFLNFFKDFFGSAWTVLSSIRIMDVIDILFITVVLFYALKFIRDRRAGKLFIGLLFLLIIQIVARTLGLLTVNYVLGNFFEVGVIALIIIFQPELRSALEKVGSEPGKRFKSIREKYETNVSTASMIENVCTAVCQMAKEKTGALIVIERETKLGEHINSGTVINADPEASMIENIFFKNAPLHDGALVIRNDRLYAAGCFLPLSSGDNYKELGTRHHAALGVSEVSDAVVIVVSEQTGTISLAIDGNLNRSLDYVSLKQKLTDLLLGDVQHTKTTKQKRRKKNRNGGADDTSDKEQTE